MRIRSAAGNRIRFSVELEKDIVLFNMKKQEKTRRVFKNLAGLTLTGLDPFEDTSPASECFERNCRRRIFTQGSNGRIGIMIDTSKPLGDLLERANRCWSP